jgi:hypothetical protein
VKKDSSDLSSVDFPQHKQPRCFAILVTIPEEINNLNFAVFNEIYPMTIEAGFQKFLKQYDYLVKTDFQVMFTPPFSNWYPPHDKPLQLGIGAYVHDQKTKDLIYLVASKLSLRNQHEHNLGYSWYGRSGQILDIAELTFTVTKHILKNHFKDGPGVWPSWYRGVALKYGSEIAINHLVDKSKWDTAALDGSSYAGRTCSIAQIRSWDGADGFRKDHYFAGKYNGIDVDSVSLRHNTNYSTFIAVKAGQIDKSKGSLRAPNTKALIRNLCTD